MQVTTSERKRHSRLSLTDCHGTGQQLGQGKSPTGPCNCMPRQQQPVRQYLQGRCNKACVRVNRHAWGDALAMLVKPHAWVNASARCVSTGPTHYKEANFGAEWKANKETYHKPTGGPSLRTTNRPTLCRQKGLEGGLPQGPPGQNRIGQVCDTHACGNASHSPT